MEKDGECKMDRQNKKCSCSRKCGRRKNNAGNGKEEEKELGDPLAKRNCILKIVLEGMIKGKEFSAEEHISV